MIETIIKSTTMVLATTAGSIIEITPWALGAWQVYIWGKAIL